MSKNIHQMSSEIKNHELDLAKRESGFLGRSIRQIHQEGGWWNSVVRK